MTIIDVRTSQEFAVGNITGSINIPLQEFFQRIDEIRSLPQPITLCCASGMRSEQAANLLSEYGITCKNGGGWMDLNDEVQKTG